MLPSINAIFHDLWRFFAVFRGFSQSFDGLREKPTPYFNLAPINTLQLYIIHS